MRLLKMTPSLGPPIPKPEEFIGSQIPPYAILSHTWDVDEPEVTLQQLLTSPAHALYPKAGFCKIAQACALAASRDSLAYTWVDTCCIDKTSSAELSEAINSMYAWYRGAAVCYVFLADLEPGTAEDLERDLGGCRWFTRGWTLQELIAPREVVFFDKTWACRGRKGELAPLLTRITGIPERVLRLEAELGTFSVAQRMSWAARRETTRVEDTAYCLLGLFDVHMSLIYGEGMKAFARLQTTIVQSTADLSIFAWVDDRVPCPLYAGMLAESPRQFAACADIEPALGDSAYSDFSITTRGIQTEASLVQELDAQGRLGRTALDTFCHINGGMVGVFVRKIGGGLCARTNPDILAELGSDPRQARGSGFRRLLVQPLTLAPKLPAQYPFSSSADPVLGNRWSALRVNWAALSVRPVDIQQAIPRSHWDSQDQAFFSCTPLTKGWCAISTIIPTRQSESRKQGSLAILLACFEWSRGPPMVVLASLDRLDPATEMLLMTQLDHIKFESCLKAANLIRGVFVGKLDGSLVSTDLVPMKYLKDKTLDIEIGLRRQSYPNVCVNPITVLDLSYATRVKPDNEKHHPQGSERRN